MRRVTFDFQNVSLEAELLETPTGETIWSALPLTGSALTWGEEVYFGVPVSGASASQAAMLAATIPSPLRDNPATDTRRFRWRTDLIAGRAF